MSGKEPYRMPMGAPVLAQRFQGALREWHVAVFVSLPVPNVDEHPITIYVSDLQMHPFLRAQTTAIDRAHHVDSLVAVGEREARKKQPKKQKKRRREDENSEQEMSEQQELQNDNMDENHIDFKA